MAIEVFKSPYDAPTFEGDWRKNEEEYIEKNRRKAIMLSTYEHAGETISFPMADGSAVYMVIDLDRVIWLEIGDSWSFEYIDRLLPEDIKKKVEGKLAFRRAFGKQKKEAQNT